MVKCNQKFGMNELEEQDTGDFAESCLPKTYEYCLKSGLLTRKTSEGQDQFDDLIRQRAPILQFMHDQYYASKKNPRLRLAALCGDSTTLDQLDTDMLISMRNPENRDCQVKIRTSTSSCLRTPL